MGRRSRIPADVLSLRPKQIEMMGDEDLVELLGKLNNLQQEEIKRNALQYYEPASEQASRVHHQTSRYVGVGGGNGASKTETCIVEMLVRATGIIPTWMKDNVPEDILAAKFRGPIRCRMVCESFINVLYPIMLPKLQWWTWTGTDMPGGEKGHWGWVPQEHLIEGSWEKSWSKELRTLTLHCKNPETGNLCGRSTIQFMSVDQDPSDFASGDYHFVLHDEPPNFAIWKENQARTMRVNGKMFLSMTWPDDPAIAVDWIFDEMYDPGKRGNHPEISWMDIYTGDNRFLDQTAVSAQSSLWSEELRRVRLFGQPIRFSNKIHPLFTDQTEWWCFKCQSVRIPVDGKCDCGSDDLTSFSHVAHFSPNPSWPTVFVLDPHPRKPHMFMWVQVDPNDDYWQVAEGELDGDVEQVKACVYEHERDMGIHVSKRLIDPNMGRSPSSSARMRGVTWQDEFDTVGLRCDLADDSDVGRGRINEMFKVDPDTRAPRAHMAANCKKTIFQFHRYVWDEFKQKQERAVKQTARPRYDDFPTMWKYLANANPTFRDLTVGAPVVRRWKSNKQERPTWVGRRLA